MRWHNVSYNNIEIDVWFLSDEEHFFNSTKNCGDCKSEWLDMRISLWS